MTPNQILKKYFGYSEFRPTQEEIINLILSGKNVLAVLPTGAGKSLCYQIPALLGEKYSIVISPLIALMKNQVDQLNKNEHLASFINSSLDFTESRKVLFDINNSGIKLLYVSPERLLNNDFIETVMGSQPDYIFIDEAHCISEWGHNFRPSYRKINEFISQIKPKNISAFTATATPEVRKDILEQLSISEARVVVRGFERKNLSIDVIKSRERKERILDCIKKYGTPAIIYTSTRKDAEQVDDFLRSKKIKSAYYHAGLANGVRTIIQDDFIEGNIQVIVATNAFGMGIDKNDVRLIIHYSIPASLENYYQEIGRAGRDGKESKAILFFDRRDKDLQEFLINSSYPSVENLRLIYNLIYDFGRVALGLSRNDSLELDENFFILLNKTKFSESILDSSLKILENSGYIEILSSSDQTHKFRFLLSADKLQAYIKKVANVSLKDTVVALLKLYGSMAFTQWTRINFIKMKELLSSNKNKIIDELMNLSSIGIIEYDMPASNIKIKLVSTRIPVNSLKFDNHYESFRINSLNKLDKMIDFVMTGDCRFRIILDYFGESVDDYRCGKCDNCLGPTESVIPIEYLEEIVMNTIHEASNRISKNDLTNILRGHSPSGRLKGYSQFGACTHFKKDEIISVIDELIDKKMLIAIDRYLSIAEKGFELFSIVSKSEENEIQDNNEENISLLLFHELLKVRNDLSKKFLQPPEIICCDELLRKISEVKPQTQSGLQNIEGMTQRTFNKIGDDILFSINLFLKSHEETSKVKDTLPKNLLSTQKLISKGYDLDEICSLLKLSDHLVAIQIESLIHFDSSLDITSLITKQELDLITKKINEGFNNLRDLKEELKNISYAKLRIVLAKQRGS